LASFRLVAFGKPEQNAVCRMKDGGRLQIQRERVWNVEAKFLDHRRDGKAEDALRERILLGKVRILQPEYPAATGKSAV